MAHALRLAWTLLAVLVLQWPAMSGARAQSAELLMFEAPGCPWCRRWHTEIGPGYPNADEGKRAPLRVLQIEQASKLRETLASPIGVSPTFVLVQHGKEVGRIVGYPGPDFFWGLLGDLIAKMDRAERSDFVPGTHQFASRGRFGVLHRQT